MPAVQETVERVRRIDVDQYKYGFVTDIESDKAPKGLSEDTVRFISAKKDEPEWMLEWRLDAYRRWLTMREPTWARVTTARSTIRTSTTIPRRRRRTARSRSTRSTRKSSRPTTSSAFRCASGRRCSACSVRQERKSEGEGGSGYGRVAVDAVFDSVSVATTFQEELAKAGVIFMPISEALREHPDW